VETVLDDEYSYGISKRKAAYLPYRMVRQRYTSWLRPSSARRCLEVQARDNRGGQDGKRGKSGDGPRNSGDSLRNLISACRR